MSGILSILLFIIIIFQSCAVGIVNTVTRNGDSGGLAGLMVALLLLAGGIVSVSSRDSYGIACDISLMVVYSLAAALGIAHSAVFKDLMVWGLWCMVCANLAAISVLKKRE